LVAKLLELLADISKGNRMGKGWKVRHLQTRNRSPVFKQTKIDANPDVPV